MRMHFWWAQRLQESPDALLARTEPAATAGSGGEDGHNLVELHDERSLLLQSAWPAGKRVQHMILMIRQTQAHALCI
jgi:hypothetical protein